MKKKGKKIITLEILADKVDNLGDNLNSLSQTVDKLAISTAKGFDGVNTELKEIGERLTGVEGKIEEVEEKLTNKINGVEERLSSKIDGLDRRMDDLSLNRVKYEDFDKLKLRVDKMESK